MTPPRAERPTVLAFSGGVGGAKLVCGLADQLEPDQLIVVCNTADDFEHLGLSICPDLDSVMYALAGLNDTERGWGRADEGWRCLESLAQLGAETWFRLGDRDLATHLERTRRLRDGESLSFVTAALCRALGIEHTIVPMSDDPVRTLVATADGHLPFQHYFVREQCQPAVTGFHFENVEQARPSPTLATALVDAPAAESDLAAIVICPSNPFVSVDPILSLPGVSEGIRAAVASVIAISPIVGGEALKGPAAKMMGELGLSVSATEVARHYADRELIDVFVLDERDEGLESQIEDLGIRCVVCDTVMTGSRQRSELARQVLNACSSGSTLQ